MDYNDQLSTWFYILYTITDKKNIQLINSKSFKFRFSASIFILKCLQSHFWSFTHPIHSQFGPCKELFQKRVSKIANFRSKNLGKSKKLPWLYMHSIVFQGLLCSMRFESQLQRHNCTESPFFFGTKCCDRRSVLIAVPQIARAPLFRSLLCIKDTRLALNCG